MNLQESEPYREALRPLLDRVWRNRTAIKTASGVRWTDEPLTDESLAKHLNGGPLRGVALIKPGESEAYAGVLDFDSHKGETPWQDMISAVRRVDFSLGARGYRTVAFRSSGGAGVHLYVLWEHKQDAAAIRALLREVLSECGFRDGAGGVAQGQVEVFPKQNSVPVGGTGNMIFLPNGAKSELLLSDFDYVPAGKDGILTLLAWEEHLAAGILPVVREVEQEVAQAAPADSIEKVRAALLRIPNSALFDHEPDYEEWFRLACATHEATGGSDEGFEAFRQWSRLSDKHDERETLKIWRHLRGGRGRSVTRATLYAKAQGFGFVWNGDIDAVGFEDVPQSVIDANFAAFSLIASSESVGYAVGRAGGQLSTGEPRKRVTRLNFDAKEHWQAAIAACSTSRELLGEICPQIAQDHRVDQICRGVLADAVKTRAGILGERLPIRAVRQLLSPSQGEEATPREFGDAFDDWVFLTDGDAFYNKATGERCTITGFNAKFAPLFVADDEGGGAAAARVVMSQEIVAAKVRGHYIPWQGEEFTIDGLDCVNLFRPSTLPVAASSVTDEGKDAIRLVKRHIMHLCNGRAWLADTLIFWLAHNVQRPGVKIRWAPLIKGVEGDGKTFLSALLKSVLGLANVNEISPMAVKSNFSDWAFGYCVGVLEELRLTGHNRHDVLNALKPYLTNSHVAVHPKGRAQFNTLNTMNYLAFTNHADSLPLTDTDRRWMVVFTPWRDLSEMTDRIGDYRSHFDALFAAVERHGSELRRWLLDVAIPATFNPNGPAPMTEEKSQMVELEVGDDEDAIAQAIERGGFGIGQQVVSSPLLVRSLRNAGIEVPMTSRFRKIMLKLGWSYCPKKVKFDGEAHRVWVKGPSSDMSAEQLRAALSATGDTKGL